MGVTINGFTYNDACEVKRYSGVDGSGNPTYTTMYSGYGDLQFGSGGNTSLSGENFQSAPKIALPVYDVLFKTNDTVEVTTTCDRKMEFTIRQWKAEHDADIPALDGTIIWLKGGTDE